MEMQLPLNEFMVELLELMKKYNIKSIESYDKSLSISLEENRFQGCVFSTYNKEEK